MRKALIVGIDEYEIDINEKNALHGCVGHAHAIADILATHGDGNPNFDVRMLTVPNNTIDRSTLRGALEELFEGSCDVCLLYFAGYGFVTSAGGYIVTSEAKRYEEGVSIEDILTLANKSQSWDKVILLDCCHSRRLGSGTISGDSVAILREGLSILTATRTAGSRLGTGNGITPLVIDALKGGATDLRGYITPASIYAYVEQTLDSFVPRPILRTNVARNTSLRSFPPSIPLETLRKICTYFLTPQEEYFLDLSYVSTEISRAKPINVAAMQDLQKFASFGLVVPVGDNDMLHSAAINSKSCRLTPLGCQYWKLVKEGKL